MLAINVLLTVLVYDVGYQCCSTYDNELSYYHGYVKKMEISQKYVLFGITTVVIVILFISLFELRRGKRLSKFNSKPPYTYYVILPQYSGLNHPVYVYNTMKIHRADLNYEKDYVARDYVKYRIHEHLVSQIGRNINKMFGFAKMAFKSKIPISTMYQSIRTSTDILNALNPTTIDPTKYKALLHKDDLHNDIFISDGILYIV